MKLLHVISSVAPRYGGPSTVIGPTIEALNRIPGVTAEVATTDADGPSDRISRTDIPSNFPIHLFRRTWSEQWMYSRGLGQWLNQNAMRYDVIHINGLWSFASVAASRAADRFDIPYIIRPDGMLSEYCLNVRGMKKRLYRRLVGNRMFRRAAAFQATGEGEARDIAVAVPGANTFVVPLGLEETAWSAPANPNRLRVQCGPAAGEKPIVLFLGRLHPVKGITDLLLPAFAELKVPAHLALAGGTDSRAAGYDREVKQTIAKLDLSDRVSLLGEVPQDDRWHLFDGAAAFVLPSFSENFGMVVAEAMARSCPVVVTDTVNASEHVAAAGCGIVIPRDVGQLAKALTTLISDPSARTCLGSAGTRYAADRLAWPRVADALMQMYQSLVPNPRGDRRSAALLSPLQPIV